MAELGGKEMLFYKAIPISVAFIRGTAADPDGNITMEREALTLDNLAIAMAAKNNGGFVIAQVERVAERGRSMPRQVKVPGTLVDCVVVAPARAALQTLAAPTTTPPSLPRRGFRSTRMATDADGRAQDHRPPRGVRADAERGREPRHRHARRRRGGRQRGEDLKLHDPDAEPGVIGGVPARARLRRGAQRRRHHRPWTGSSTSTTAAGSTWRAWGLAQCDAEGNVNVSRFGPRLAGAGGFINISQNASRVVFAGTFTAGGLEIAVEDGKLRIVQEGRRRKFVERGRADHLQRRARPPSARQPVLYVTERCVFRLTAEGLAADRGRARDRYRARHPRPHGLQADRRRPARHGRAHLPRRADGPRARRCCSSSFRPLHLRRERDTLFMNFEGLQIRTQQDIDAVRDALDERVQGDRPEDRRGGQLRRLRARRRPGRGLGRGDGALPGAATTARSAATPRARSCA